MAKNVCKHGTEYNQKNRRSVKPCSCCNSEYPYDNDDRSGYCPGCRGDIQVQSKILQKRLKFEEKLKEAYVNIRDLKNECTHPRTFKAANSNTGNWSKSDDYYWYDCSCPDCGYNWTETQ